MIWKAARFLCMAVVGVAALMAPHAAEASTFRWLNVTGDWNDPANWTLVDGPLGAGYPNGSGDTAQIFGPANFTVTIPDGVTITLERLHLAPEENITITSAGSGRLVFDSADGEAHIDAVNFGRPIIDVPIELQADLLLTTLTSMDFSREISDDGTPHGVTIQSPGVFRFTGTVSNTYAGTTTVRQGRLELGRTNGAIAIAGPLVIEQATEFAPEVRLLAAENIADNAPVHVSQTSLGGRFNVNNLNETVGELTIGPGGSVTLGDSAAGRLAVSSLTMEGGHLNTGGAGSELVLNGNVSAAIGEIAGAGTLALGNGAARVFTVSAPAPNVSVTGLTIRVRMTGTAGLVKDGPGELFLRADNDYTGGTVLLDGELSMSGNHPATPVTLTGGVLSGNGTVGAVTATGGTISPEFSSNTDVILSTGSLALSPGVGIRTDLFGQLAVAGAVSIGGAVLDAFIRFGSVTPLAVITIIHNDGSDAVIGTFAGLPEGGVLVVGAHRFLVSYQGGDGNDVVLQNITPIQYSLAEGATGTFFDEDILIANPNTVDAPVTLTFLLPGGGTIVQTRNVPALSRLTVKVDELQGLEAISASVVVVSDLGRPLAVERTMFWDATHYAGHTANAVSRPATRWLFAEGAQGFFNTFLMLANSNASDIDATVTFLRENDSPVTDTIRLAANSRTTVYAGDYAGLVDRSFGIVVEAPQPIAAERAMYFATTPEQLWSGGHANAGSTEAATRWFHPEGASGTFFTTFILMSNPNNADAPVTLRFLLPDGRSLEIPKTIPAFQRLTVNPAAEGIADLQNTDYSVVVTSNFQIVSERAMYWPVDGTTFGEGHVSSGLVSTSLSWAIAEGRVGGPSAYSTYIQLANPSDTAADVTVTFLRETGEPIVKTYTVNPTSRFTVDAGGMVPELQNESFGARIDVTNQVQIAVERSMYWNAGGSFWAGGSNSLGTAIPAPVTP